MPAGANGPEWAGDPYEAAIYRKVGLRLIPFLFLLYVINLIDRTNIGIARLQMVDEQHILDENWYGIGSGIFYIGYFLFEIPSNLILVRVGARAWIARILVSWGIISAAMMFVTGPWSFCALRILLGIAEAGFFPGIVFYLGLWFPMRARARAMATFMAGGVVTSIINNPLSGTILQHTNQIAGLWGWQWLFLIEGMPAIILGIITFYYLTDRPSDAYWLTAEERNWLIQRLADEQAHQDQHGTRSWVTALGDMRVWLLIAVYFAAALGENCYGFYAPKFVKDWFPSLSSEEIGWLSAVPSVVALIGMNLIGWHSDHTQERRWHVGGSAFLGASGWMLIALAPSQPLFLLGLAMATTGTKSMLPTFWTIPPSYLSGAAAAGGLALINSVGNLGGFVGPLIIGKVKTVTGDFTIAFFVIAATLLVGGALVVSLRVPRAESPRQEVEDFAVE
jgi:MFS family permease